VNKAARVEAVTWLVNPLTKKSDAVVFEAESHGPLIVGPTTGMNGGARMMLADYWPFS